MQPVDDSSSNSTSSHKMADQRQTVLITGCSSGIGAALARAFHDRGCRVLATARNASSLSTLRDLGIEALSLELTDPASIARLKDEVHALTGGRLDILINNAGRNYTMPALDVDFEDVQQTFEVNLFAVMRMCQAFGPLLVEAKGKIVTVGSVNGILPMTFSSTYNASKAAVHAYMETLRIELAPLGVQVTTIITGGILSNLARVDRQLPPGSYYIPHNDVYRMRLLHGQHKAMPADDYARSVANHVLKRSPSSWFWEGHMSWVVWLGYTFFPHSVFDMYMNRRFKLWRLADFWNKKRA